MENNQQPTTNIEHPTVRPAWRHWMLNVGGWLLDIPKLLLILALRIYRMTISPAQMVLFGNTFGCRFTPSCSAYALEAVREHGAVIGSVLAAKRICRCHPWGGCGHDPVPKKGFTRHAPRITF